MAEAGKESKKQKSSELGIDKESLKKKPKAYLGRRACKYFEGDGLFFGTITDYRFEGKHFWKIVYDDEDEEEFDVDDMMEFLQLYEDKAHEDKKA